MKLAGILYLHEITQGNMDSRMLRDLEVFRQLCGKDAEKNVILVTTKWAEPPATMEEEREKELSDEFWKPMIDHGSRIARFFNSCPSAWDVLRPIVENKTVIDALRIQEELVDLGKNLSETDAAKVTSYYKWEPIQQMMWVPK